MLKYNNMNNPLLKYTTSAIHSDSFTSSFSKLSIENATIDLLALCLHLCKFPQIFKMLPLNDICLKSVLLLMSGNSCLLHVFYYEIRLV